MEIKVLILGYDYEGSVAIRGFTGLPTVEAVAEALKYCGYDSIEFDLEKLVNSGYAQGKFGAYIELGDLEVVTV